MVGEEGGVGGGGHSGLFTLISSIFFTLVFSAFLSLFLLTLLVSLLLPLLPPPPVSLWYTTIPCSYGTCCYWSDHSRQTMTAVTQNPGSLEDDWGASATWGGWEEDHLEAQSQRAWEEVWVVC